MHGTADVNADGRTDILWRQASGSTVARLMNAFNSIGSVGVGGDSTWTLLRRPGYHAA